VLTAWCDVCNLDAELFERWAVLARRTDGPIPSWFESWLEAEGKAHALKIWQPLIIPGLFQTGEYARALFLAAGTDTERADELVAARLERQAILERPDPPHVIAVLEAVEDVTAESRSLVRRATVVFDLVRGDALPRTASRALITEAAEQWKTR
jgi:hypothetical protein